jgi:hypothetical protein
VRNRTHEPSNRHPLPGASDTTANAAAPSSSPAAQSDGATPKRPWRLSLLSKFLHILAVLVLVGLALRIALPYWLRTYVNRTIDKHPLYDGTIGDVDLHLLRGGYTIRDIRLNKTTGNVPVPFFAAKRVDITVQWDALLAGKVVGKIDMLEPQLNFVDSSDPSSDQSGGNGKAYTGKPLGIAGDTGGAGGGGATGPWLEMIRDLFPFRINSVQIHNGDVHFRAFESQPPVDVFLSNVEGGVENLTNIHDEVTPLVTRAHATALAMNQAPAEFDMKFDPFSYRPTFQLAVRLVGLDVTQTNALAKAYGSFDFERGFFDLVIEVNAKEGLLEGYIKPLFRHLTVLSLKKDIKEDNVLEFFWEALVGVGMEVFKNQPRDQVATLIPLTGDLNRPNMDVLTVIGNVLRNAFIRAYLPRFERTNPDVDYLQFGKAAPLTPDAPQNQAPITPPPKNTNPLLPAGPR